jgi:hypothetical protein
LAGKEPTLGFGKDEKGDPIPMKGGITVVDGTPPKSGECGNPGISTPICTIGLCIGGNGDAG